MPNDLQPSDHISLVGDFSFCSNKIDTGSMQSIGSANARAKSSDNLSSWPSLGVSDKIVDNVKGSIPSWPSLADGNDNNKNKAKVRQKKKRAPYKLSLGNY